MLNTLTRLDEVVLHRIRVGHTHLTHAFLLKRETPPECNHCNCLLTDKHILVECPLHNTSRTKHYTATTLHQFFNTVHSTHIIKYLDDMCDDITSHMFLVMISQEINYYSKL